MLKPQTPTERQWWPLDWADEVMPPGRLSPEGFLIEADGDYYLGYALDAEDASEQEKRHLSRKIASGDIVKFICCEQFGEIDITINPDGTFTTDEPPPTRANRFMVQYDPDTMADNLETFVKYYIENEALSEPRTETLSMAWWSEELPHKLTVTYEGTWPPKASFAAVTESEAKQ